MILRLTSKRKIMTLAFCTRIIMLFVIILLAEKLPAYGFIKNSPDYDDFRYEEGAVIYAEYARSIIDIPTFTRIFDSMGDWTGHHLSHPLTEGFLWYWIVCILTYFTKWRWWIRILNIVLSVFVTKYIYELSTTLFSEKVGKTASLFYAVFPYTVIFSCFSYKDTLVSFCTFYIVNFFSQLRNGGKNNLKKIIKLIIVCLIFIFVRSGISEILIGFSLLYYYFKPGERLSVKKLIGIFVLIIVGFVMMFLTIDLVIYKFNAYIGNSSTAGLSGAAWVKITGLCDIWKLPMTFVFSILQPIELTGEIESWLSIVSNFNILMCPIAISAFLCVLFRKSQDKYLSLLLIVFYFICCVSSVTVFRQLYSIWPIPVIYGINYLIISKLDRKIMVYAGSIILAAMIIVFFC